MIEEGSGRVSILFKAGLVQDSSYPPGTGESKSCILKYKYCRWGSLPVRNKRWEASTRSKSSFWSPTRTSIEGKSRTRIVPSVSWMLEGFLSKRWMGLIRRTKNCKIANERIVLLRMERKLSLVHFLLHFQPRQAFRNQRSPSKLPSVLSSGRQRQHSSILGRLGEGRGAQRCE